MAWNASMRDAEAEHAERQDQPTEQQCSEGSDDEYDD